MLSLEGVDVYYGEVQALFDVSIDVFDGEIVSIIGSNGAGKTTTMRSIMGLRSPKKGKITFDGQEIHKLPTHKIVDKGIVYVPEGRLVFPDLSVEVNLEMGAYSRNYSKAEMQQMMEEQFELFPRLKERRNQLAGSLSGGEQQMLAIARGLMSDPKLIMFDEPSLGLAPVIVDDVFNVIVRINKEKNIPILLVEQNAFMALSISNRTYVLENGVITSSGKSSDLIESDEIRKAYLGG
ncbi:MAG: ABC transporter ATP-binding protein [Erysipelotrichaceae bacterium]|nr:ABC transporter ATP-binding protein [Erysipelotrichaceae bacterium]